MRRLLLMISLLMVSLLAACGGNDAADAALQKIRLPMGYIADPQYAPFYVAVDRGYFADAGIEIEFDYSFETDGIALVGAGELSFAVASGEQVILARAQGLPIVYVHEWFQQYPIAVVSKTSSGIVTPEDLRGRSLGLPGFFGASYVGYVGFLTANGLTQPDVNATDVGFAQVEALFRDEVEAVVGYINNEPIQLAQLGEEVTVFAVSDYIDLVSNGIVTNEATIANNPELVQGFVDALRRGTQDTLDNPAAAYEISKKFVEGLQDDRKEVLNRTVPLWQAPQLGYTDPASWVQTQEILLSMGEGFLDAPLDDLSKAYTNQFVTP